MLATIGLAPIGLALVALGGAGLIVARLLVLRRRGPVPWAAEIRLIALFPLAIVTLVLVSVWDEPISRADPMTAGTVMTLVLASLGAYALWLGHRYDSLPQRAIGVVAVTGAGLALVAALIGAGLRLL